jgi:predicted transcriptional regulator
MATGKRKGNRTVTLEVSEELAQRLDDLSKQTGRSVSAEVNLALAFWLERQGVGESAVEEESKPPRRPPLGK